METTLAQSTRWWKPLRRADRLAILLMVGLPTLLFAVPALFGHPAISQDNLIQNFPLRVLTGQQLDSGHLPLFNPLADSGTPLLGGMNAGSFFPLTFLFAVLPAIMSWVLNLIAVYVVAAFGVFALLRWHGLRTFSSLVPAIVYAYSGAMIGQLVHLGVIQGYALLPWAILAMLALAQAVERTTQGSWRVRARAVLPGVAGLSALWGLTSLTGEPRAIAEMQLVLLIVGPVVLFVRSAWQPSTWKNRFIYVVSVGVGVAWGVGFGLAQLLPGWEFIKQSQRTGLTYQWFGAGSLATRWTTLLLIPDIFGGNGVLHQPNYFVSYNLPEVTGYVGVLALVAAAAFVVRFTKRGWRGDDQNWIVYVVLAVVGMFATWGYFTPAGHLFRLIPLFGSTRLQSRSIILVDLAVVVLLGWFLERLCERDFARAGLVGWRKFVTLSPAIAVAGLSLAMLFFGNAIVDWITKNSSDGVLAHFERPTLVLHLLIALAIIICLVWGLRSRRLLQWLTVFVMLDVVIFLVFCGDGFLAGHVNVEPSRADAITLLDAQGRFALVDPSGAHHDEFDDLGAPNMNVFTKLPSVQGYGSLIDELYGNVTATHPLYGLDTCQLAKDVFRQLRLSSIAVPTNKLTATLPLVVPIAPLCLPIAASTRTLRYFGQEIPVRSLFLKQEPGEVSTNGTVRVQLFNSKGGQVGAPVSLSAQRAMTFNFAALKESAAGAVITSSGAMGLASAVVTTNVTPAISYELNTPYQQALTSSLWRMEVTSGTLTFFKATSVRASAWLGGDFGTSRITGIRNSLWGDSWVSVDATHSTVLKRSMEWIPGWHATARNDVTGKSMAVHVVRSGLIQQVIVPPGKWTVHFHYHAPLIEVGLAGSVGSFLALVAAAFLLRGWVPKRRKDRVTA